MSEKELDEKLQNFSFLVMEDAEKRRTDIIHRVESETKERLEEKENQFLSDAYEYIQQNVAKYRKEDNEKVLHVEVDSRRELLLKREQIIQNVFDEVEKKISEFKASAEYGEWLIRLVKKAVEEVGRGEKTVFLAAEDMKYQNKLRGFDLFSGKITVEPSEDMDFMGGVKVYNQDRRVAVDYSFKELLQHEKSEFLQTSGLVIG